MKKWQHCKLEGNRVEYLGAAGLFDNRADAHMGKRKAWSRLEDEGWEMVSAITNPDGEPVFYFKRPATAES